MPGERPRGAPLPATTRDLHPCPGAGGLRHPSQPPHEDQPSSSRIAQGTRRAGSRALASEPPKARPGQALEVEPQTVLQRPQPPHGPLGKRGGPHTPPSRSHPGTQVWLASRVDNSPLQLYSLGIASTRAKPGLDEPSEDQAHEAPQDSQAEADCRPSLPVADTLPTPRELCSQRCFQEAPSSFTSSNCTSPGTTPGPPQAPPSSPPILTSLPELQPSGASSWPPAAEDNFPGANFGVPPNESEPFPEGSRPGSPQGSSFPYPPRAQAPHEDMTQQAYANRALDFSFHQTPGGWPEVAMGTSPAYGLPPTPSPLPCYSGQPGGLEAPGDCTHALSPPGAAPLALRPLPNSVHKSLPEVPPEGPPAGCEGLGSPRAPPNPGSQRHFSGQAYGANRVGNSPGPGDIELAPRPLPARLPQLWDPTAAPYPEPTLRPPPTPGASFFDSSDQQLCLSQGPPTVPWSSVLPSPRPTPRQLEVLSRLPFPGGTSEWQESSQGALGAASQAPRPGETLVALRTSPGQPRSSPGLISYTGVKDSGAQPLFFGGTQPQASPRGAPGLPPARVVGVSPSESPLPSPATNTAGSSTCSSLSPLSSSPANPSSEDSQLPASLGPSGCFLPGSHPHETGTPFQSPEASNTCPAHFPLSSDGLGPEGTLKFPDSKSCGAGRDGLQGFPRGPATFAAHHFPLSSASLDQLDVLLTCRQCDRTYSSLAAFLEHRQFCGRLPAQHRSQGHPAPTVTPKGPVPMHPGSLSHSQTIPFLLAGDLPADGKDDTLRMSFLPSLAAPPFPLPTSDLDLEDSAKLDDAKLDSLITEALNGMQDPSDSPEIDSSFIDVFADEDPPGPRAPSTGQPLSTLAGTSLEHHVQPLLLAEGGTLQARAPYAGDRACPAQSGADTTSPGPASTKAVVPSLGRQSRRGKQLKVFWKELDAAHSTKGPRRAPCSRPGRRGRSTQQPPPHPQDLRTQAKSHKDPQEQGPRALFLPTDTRTTRHLRLPPRKDPRKQRAQRGGSWSKELIHKIVLQKNKLYRPQAPLRVPQGRLGGWDCASESEEESPGPGDPGHRGPPHCSRRQRRLGKKVKEEGPGQGPSKAARPEPSESRGPPGPRQLSSLAHSPERDPKCTGHPTGAPMDSPEIPTNTTTPEVRHLSLDPHQAAQNPRAADPTKPREVPTWERGHTKPSTPEPTPPGRADTSRPPLSGSHLNVLPSRSAPRPAGGSLQDTPGCTGLPQSHDKEYTPAHQPRHFQTPVASPTRASYPELDTPFFKNSDLGCNPAHFNRDSMEVTAAKKGSQANSSAPDEPFLRPKGPAVDTPPATSSYPGQDHVDAIEPRLPQTPPCPAETDPGGAQSPLTLESTTLFAGLPEDSFDPPLYNSLSPHRASTVPLACSDTLPRKSPIDPLFPPFLLLEEVSPTLSSQFSDLSGPKAVHRKCFCEETVPPSPIPVPEKRNEHNADFKSNLSEDELEIKRLVSELESQLQRRRDTSGAPGDIGKATHAASPTPSLQAAFSHSAAAQAPCPGELSSQQEDTGTPTCQRKERLRSPKRDQLCPGKTSPCPSSCKDLAEGALSEPVECSLEVLMTQKSRGCTTQEDPRAPSCMCLPDPSKQPETTLEARGLQECGPNCNLLFPRSDKSTRTWESKGSPSLLPWEQTRAQSPKPQGAERPCSGRPATTVPDQVIPGSGVVSLDAVPPPDASQSHTPRGPEPLHTMAEGSALHLQDAPSQPGPCAIPACSPSHPLEVLGGRTKDKSGIQVLQGPPSARAQSPQHRGPPGLGGDRMIGGSLRGVQDIATSTVSEADEHLDSSGQAKKTKGHGKASHCPPEAWKSPRAPGNNAKASTFNIMPRPASATGEPQGRTTPLGLQEQVPPAPILQCSPGTVAHTQQGAEDRTPSEVTTPALPTRVLAPCASMATPIPCTLEHTPQEDSSHMTLGGDVWAQSPVGAGPGVPPEGPPSLMTSLCGTGDIQPPTLLRASSPQNWPDLSNVLTPTQVQDSPSSSTLGALEDFRRAPGSSPACDTTHPGAHMSPRRTIQEHNTERIPTKFDTKTIREFQVQDPSVSWTPSSHPPCLTPYLGHREGHSITAVPTGPTAVGSTEPGPFPCLERDVGAISDEQEDTVTSGAWPTSMTKVPRDGSQGLTQTCFPQAASPRNIASDPGSNSPQSPIRVPHQMPQMDPLSAQNSKQKPYGFKKKLEPTEKRKSQAPAGPPVTSVICEICSASFRSGPGLSRHKARKHRPQGGAAPECGAPGKKSRRAPGKERPSHTLMCPSHPAVPAPTQGSTGPEGTPSPKTKEGAEGGSRVPGHTLNQQPHPQGLMEPGEEAKPKPDRLVRDKLHPRQSERRERQRRGQGPRDSPPTVAQVPEPQDNRSKAGARRPRGQRTPRGSVSVPADLCCPEPPTVTATCLIQGQCGANQGPRLLGDVADNTSLGALYAQKSPGGRRSPRGRAEGVSPGELSEGWKGALARELWGPTVAGTSGKDLSHSSAGEAAEGSAGAKEGSGDSVKAGTLDLPTMSSSEVDGIVFSCSQGLLDTPGAQGGGPEAPSPACRDPPSVLDDDVSFAQLFPPGGRFARKKNPRVYGKRCQRLRCLPPPEPLSQAGDNTASSAQLPTDLSDSGSLCLTCEDLLGNKAVELPESWLLGGSLNSSTPGLSVWALESSRESGCVEEEPPCGPKNDQAEAIPELHRVPAAWRGLELQALPKEASSPPGDASPEPPNLEREGYDEGLPGTPEDLEMIGTTLKAQDMACTPSTSTLDLQVETAGPCQALDREWLAPGRGQVPFKCRVCFRRFHGLGELDLHRLAHSAAPPPTCYMCVERRFSSRQLLREHLQEKHVQGQVGPWACGMCLKEVADVWMYNQHLREHAALFARRGQARQALDELPAGSGEEGTALEHGTSQPGAGRAGRADRRVGEVAPRDREERALSESFHRASTPPSVPGGESPATPSRCPDPRPHSEPPLSVGPVHADCKDPSRDCHHCGKRFPKPFKLQRHLAVHSPQRVYLCPRCPRIYAAHRELRAHLGGVHGAGPEASDVAPTPVFACERCADVARVTRRAFACSACNYTFARREQLDRHREKHRRACPRPYVLRSVRRPGAPDHALPSKRRKLAGLCTPGHMSPNSPALPQLCPQAAPGTAQAQERREDSSSHPDPSVAGPDLPAQALTPLPNAQAEGGDGGEPDRALERRLEGKVSADSPGPRRLQAPHLVSGKHGSPGSHARCTPDQSPRESSLLPKEKQLSPCHVVPEGATASPSHEGSATKLGACRSASKPKPLTTIPSRAPKQPTQARKSAEVRSPASSELAHGPEDRMKPTTPKSRPRPSSQGNAGARTGTKTAGGSQPQPSSGRLQSETATTPAKPNGPGPSPAPHQAPLRAQARACPKGAQGCPGPQEKLEGSEKKRKGPGPARRESTGSSGRATSAPDRPPRAPRKQATPSRVLPTKSRPGSQINKTRLQSWNARKGEPSPSHRREVLGKAFPQVRKGRSISSTRPTEPQDHRTAESQSDLLSQLFGQRLTSFKIPLKKDTSE